MQRSGPLLSQGSGCGSMEGWSFWIEQEIVTLPPCHSPYGRWGLVIVVPNDGDETPTICRHMHCHRHTNQIAGDIRSEQCQWRLCRGQRLEMEHEPGCHLTCSVKGDSFHQLGMDRRPARCPGSHALQSMRFGTCRSSQSLHNGANSPWLLLHFCG